MLNTGHYHVDCDKTSSMDLSAQLWPESSGTDSAQGRKNKGICGNCVLKDSICHLSPAKVLDRSHLCYSVRAVQSFEKQRFFYYKHKVVAFIRPNSTLHLSNSKSHTKSPLMHRLPSKETFLKLFVSDF